MYLCPSNIPSVCLFDASAQMETDAPTPRLNCGAKEKSEKQELQLFQRGCRFHRRASPSSSFLLHSLSFAVHFFPPAISLPATSPVSHLSFDMEISHQPQPKARWLVPKIYLLKAAQFLIKCSRWADKRWVLWWEKQQLKATEAASTVLQIPEFNKGTETIRFVMAYVKMGDISAN